jgi:hypothetical protein
MSRADFPLGDDEKLRELILYICRHSEGDPSFGVTKLNLLLFSSDFCAYLYLGEAMTGQEYQVSPQGPAPRQLISIRDKMIENKELYIRESNSLGIVQKVPLALREPRLTKFNGDEVVLADAIIHQSWKMSAAQISEKSQDLLGWKLLGVGEKIPYSLAHIGQSRKLTEQELVWAKELEPMAQEALAGHAFYTPVCYQRTPLRARTGTNRAGCETR